MAVDSSVYNRKSPDHRKFDLLEGLAWSARVTKARATLGPMTMDPADASYASCLDMPAGIDVGASLKRRDGRSWWLSASRAQTAACSIGK